MSASLPRAARKSLGRHWSLTSHAMNFMSTQARLERRDRQKGISDLFEIISINSKQL